MKRLLLALSIFAVAPAAAETVAITGGRVVIGDGSPPIEGGTVLIENGRIAAAGASVSVPAAARVIDAGGKWVTPGIVAGFSRVGLVEVGAVDPTNDTQANGSPFSAAIDVAPAINPKASPIAIGRAGGVTRAIVAPISARNIFAGQGAVIDLGEDMQPITRARAFQYVELGERGAAEAGGSRASAHALFRNALREAGALARDIQSTPSRPSDRPPLEEIPDVRLRSAGLDRPDDVLLTRFDAAALLPVVRGSQLLFVHAERASDILEALALKRDFPELRMVLIGAAEGWTVASEIAAAGVPVIADPLLDLPSDFETAAATQSNIGRMRDAGVEVAAAMIGGFDAHQLYNLPQLAGNLVAIDSLPGHNGLSWSEAFAAISSRPAEAVGLGHEIGSLRPGRRADVVIWDGDPLELSSAVEALWIDGVPQSLENRQTRLRDRYRDLDESDLPKAYDR
ncbi:MAG: amidohydrolase family protein [Sphingomonadaceae bacterium]